MVSAYLFLGLAFGAVSVSADSHHGHAVKLSAESNPGVTDPQGKACYYLHDLDYPGYDVGNKPAKDYHDCTKICGDFKGCVTWSWTKHGGGTCWLKSKAPKGVDSKGSIALGCEKFPDNAKRAMRTHGKKSGSTHVTIKVHQSNPSVKLSAESNPGVTDPQGKACHYLHDIDYPGYDVGNKPSKDYHDCTKICGDFKGCVTWSWSKHNGGTCWLKSKAPKGVDSKGTVVLGCEKFPANAKRAMKTHGKKSHSNPSVKLSAESNPGVTDPQGKACHYLHDIDYPGYDVGNKPSKDYHDCTKICGDFKGCVTWSWSKHNGGTCWLKSKAPKGVDSKGTVVLGCEKFPANAKRAMKTHGKKSHSNPSVKLSAESNPGVTDPQGKACHYLHDIDYPGYDVGNKPSKDYHDCTKICGDFKGCVTWSWSKHNGGTCWLKSKAPKGVDSKGTVVLGCEKFPANAKRAMKTHGKKSGSTHVTIKIHQSNPSVKLSAESNPGVTDPQGRACHYLHDIDYPGYDVGNKPSKDYHDCTKICGDFKGCVTWSWSKHNGGTCWLKSKAPKGVDSKGTVVLGCEKFPQRA